MNQKINFNQGSKIVNQLESQYHINLDQLIETIKSYNKNFHEDNFRRAVKFAAVAHDGQVRKQEGIPYIVHPLETVKILAQIHADEETLIAAILHDVPEDTTYTLEQIESLFGKQVAYLVEGITKLSKVHYRNNMQQRDVESMKKLFIHVSEDPRTMLIKLADRLHNMRTLEFMDVPEKRLRKAKETLEIFTPIASLLGIKEIQLELEDLCFKNLYPEDYQKLKEVVAGASEKNRYRQDHMIESIETMLQNKQIEAIVYPYQNSLYDTYKRLRRDNKSIEDYEIHFFINVIVDDIPSCYNALGLIHSSYRPKPGSFKDYISTPKANGYRSLHTTVFGDNGIITKFCIRTHQMHYEAQYGIAASYFNEQDAPKTINGHDPRSQWVKDVLQIQKEHPVESRYLDELKQFVFSDRISVITPKGKAIELPINATCIDFAYAIHTEVGNRAIRAIVNGENVPLHYQLKKGDLVKIITTDYPKSPSYEWLSFAITPQARKKMSEYFKHESSAAKVQNGRRMLQIEYDRAGLGLVNSFSKIQIAKINTQYPWMQIKNLEDLLINIAEGAISTIDLVNLLYTVSPKTTARITDQENQNIPNLIKNLIKFKIRILAKPHVNLLKILEVFQKRKDSVVLVSTLSKYNFWKKQLMVDATMYVQNFNDISTICLELEQIDGVKEVTRQFTTRKLIFFLGSIFIFMFWAIHPYALYYITSQLAAPEQEIRFLSNTVLFTGLLILFSLIYFLQRYTARSFPGLRETNRLWMVAYILSFFALITVFLEIYLYKIHFDWVWVLMAVVVIFAYLTGEYIYYKDQKKV